MLADNTVSMKGGMQFNRWRMKLQTYLVEAKKQTFDKGKCYLWMKPSLKVNGMTYGLDNP